MSLTRVPAASARSRTPSPDEVAGVVVTVEPSYPRDVGIGWHILLPILLTAAVARLLWLFAAVLLREGKSSGGGQRSLKELRRGPEFLVTEFTIRQDDGSLVELEIHGHLAKSALLPRDRIRAAVRRQKRRDLPLRAYRVQNDTSGRMHRLYAPTRWSHIGPALLLQAVLGLMIIVLAVVALAMRHS